MRRLNIMSLLLVILIVIISCQKEEINTDFIKEAEENKFTGKMTQLGEKLENPFSVINMRKAYHNIKGKSHLLSSEITESAIKTTHLYVRFLPKTNEEYEFLLNKEKLELFDYPLDYEIKEGGTYYQDPDLPDSMITWQYCAVKKDFVFPNFEYEIIEELFLPESIEKSTNFKSNESRFFLDELEVEALKNTGNYKNLEKTTFKSKSNLSKTEWKPSGTIKVYDDFLDWVPVVGCKARAQSWFTVKSDLTDKNGYFFINHNFKSNVNYSIKWEREDFDIRSGNWGQAYYNGPSYKEKKWNLNIDKSGVNWFYAHIHRAANAYWYNNLYGVKTPPKNSFWKRKIKIGLVDKMGRDYFQSLNRLATFPEIKMYTKFLDDTERNSKEIYNTTIHELAHCSHWELGRFSYGNAYDIVVESWALGVAYVFTKDLYGSDIFDWNDFANFSIIKNELEGTYTPLVVDLMDNINQSVYYNTLGSRLSTRLNQYPKDRVTGFSLGQIENALRGAETLSEWRNNLKKLYNISTDDKIDELFENYINL